MSIASLSRIAAVSSLSLLAACTQTPSTISLDEERVSRCPLELARGQTVLINLRSNPTTGFRWQVQDAAPGVLRSLGPEVYSNPEDSGLVGSAGQSSWRFEAAQPGSGRLLLVYRRPWETGVAPEQTFDCQVTVE
ncbi:MAG: protease inhibitor I42 family protein [Pseudomonadales bacterium]|jgi:inhibitor of cysteine peptidase|nr:protease inhibitor I42 family protein [Pseudomonadales bacterium]